MTNNIDVRRAQHIRTGRLFGGNRLTVLDRNLTHGQARGFEQARIEFHGTRTGISGQEISPSNAGNKNNSLNTARTDARGRHFNNARTEKLNQLNGNTSANRARNGSRGNRGRGC